MATIRITSSSDTPDVVARDIVDEAMKAKLSEGELSTSARFYHPGSETELQLFEATVPPDTVIGQHAHDEDEIIYVIEGQLRLGRQVLEAGTSVFIPGNTLYSFRAGPNGLRFLNFRARQDLTYVTKQEFMARRTKAMASKP